LKLAVVIQMQVWLDEAFYRFGFGFANAVLVLVATRKQISPGPGGPLLDGGADPVLTQTGYLPHRLGERLIYAASGPESML
jgi:hypothetical protein